MPAVTIDLPGPVLDRLRAIASAGSTTVDEVVRRFVDVGLHLHDDTELEELLRRPVRPLPPRPQLPPHLRALVDQHKATLKRQDSGGEQGKPSGGDPGPTGEGGS